jgi:hypothetical protein
MSQSVYLIWIHFSQLIMIESIVPPVPPESIKLKPVPAPQPPKILARLSKTTVEPEAVLVSGLAFPRERGQKIRDVFSTYCEQMARRLNKKYPGIVITVFNFYEGAQQLYEFDAGVLKISTVKSFGKLNPKNYRYINWDDPDPTFEIEKPKNILPDLYDNQKELYYIIGISKEFVGAASVKSSDYKDAFFDGKIKENSISIKDVYDYIQNLGYLKPGNLKELHFFSRADPVFGEPTLVHSLTGMTLLTSKLSTKYIHKDGEYTDFLSKGSGAQPIDNLKYFEAAFDKDTTIVFWGSFLDRFIQNGINNTMNLKNYKQMLLEPEKPFLINGDGDEESLQQVTDYIRVNYLEASYAYILGQAIFRKGTKRNIYLAPPGTDATTDDEIKQKKFGDPLMHIFMGEDFEDPPHQDFRGILKFYHEAMGMSFFEPKEKYHKIYGRGYIKIDVTVHTKADDEIDDGPSVF